MTVVVLGGINEDVVAEVTALPRPGETVPATRVRRSPGGKGLNQAVAAARQGATVRLAGAVGQDEAGRLLLAFLAREGVDASGILAMPDLTTGRALIALTPAGANTIIVDAAANAAFGAAEMHGAHMAGDVILTQFEATLPAIEALFRSAAAAGAMRILNTAPAIMAGRPLLDLADIVILNETELQAYAGSEVLPATEADIVDAARGLLTRADQHVVVTLGAAGCLHATRDRHMMIVGYPADAVDTVGAGDCFCGVLAAALDEGLAIEPALRFANAAAALSVMREGAAEAAPRGAEVVAFLGT